MYIGSDGSLLGCEVVGAGSTLEEHSLAASDGAVETRIAERASGGGFGLWRSEEPWNMQPWI